MARETLIYRPDHPAANERGMVAKHLVYGGGSDAPHIIRDTMDPLQHPCTGEFIDSKSQFRRITKAHGCIELGNEQPQPRQTWDRVSRDDVRAAIHKVSQGYRPSLQSESLD